MERRVYVDYLKVLACITIVALHVIGQGTVFGTNETVDIYLMCIQLLTRWAVPAFVMASGCNLLGRENGFAVAKKHILKMLRLVLVWGLIYVAEDPVLDIIRGKTCKC